VSAPALRDVQASFWRALHAGETDDTLVRGVLPSPSLTPEGRVDVYRQMYFWRLYEVLREDFPKTHAALGDEFEDVVRGYLARHPSENPSVRHLGARLADFLETDAAARSRPWLPDLARLERARVDAFDAPDATSLRASDLAAVTPERWAELRFALVPALDVVRSRWPVHEVWADAATAPPVRATVVRVWRQEFAVFHAAMDVVEDTAFAAVRAGASFAEVCAAVAEHVDDDAAPGEAGALLARWVEDGLIAGASSNDDR
jgi:hypothetical protein